MKTKVLIKIGILILISFFLFPGFSKAAVIINEIAWMGTENSASDEWIELYSDQEVDLSGWSIESVDGSPVITLEGTISSNSYFLLERTDDETVPLIIANQIYSGALGNTGEHLILKNVAGDIVDEINQLEGWSAGNNSTKQTMERIGDTWQTSSEPSGTPKMPNSSGEILSNNQPALKNPVPENLSPSKDQPPIARAGSNLIAFIDEEIIFDGSQSYDPDGKDLAYEWNLGEGGVLNDIIISHKYTYPGTYLVTLMVFDGRHYDKETITVNIYPKKITINEFLPDPLGRDGGDEENLGEWIELYNDSNQIIDISGWQLDDEEGGSRPFIFPVNTLIRPKGYLVLSRQITKIALNNDNDKVRLLLSTGIVFQEISYENAPEGESSAQTSKGFVWSMPTPGLPNIIISENNFSSSNFSFQSQVTKQSSEKIQNTTLYSENTLNSRTDNSELQKGSSSYYNLANLSEATSNDSNLFLIVLISIVILSLIGIGILKFKKKL